MTELKLGRSFQDLMEENKVEYNENEEIIEVELSSILPNPDQPRGFFEENSLKELAQSIKEHGVIQPVILKSSHKGYVLVAGERRVRASLLAGQKTIPAIIREYNTKYFAELAILENLQREDLTAFEEAIAYSKLLRNSDLTHEQLGKKIGKSRVYITNILGLMKLPAVVVEDLNSKKLTMGHARALSKIKDVSVCLKLRDEIIADNLTVRELEKLIRNLNKKKLKTIPVGVLKNAEKELQSFIKEDFKINISKNTVSFKFKNQNELKKIIEFLKRG